LQDKVLVLTIVIMIASHHAIRAIRSVLIPRRAFTLVELLVVISIIGLLSTIAVVSLSSARTKARDAKRKADLHQIGLALAVYYEMYGTYPVPKPSTSCGNTDVWAESKGTCGGQWLTADANFIAIMPQAPMDPINTGTNAGWGDGNYVYSYYVNPGVYELVTQLENPNDPDRCGNKPAIYHTSGDPWCMPWSNVLDRSQNIYTDH
jgi:prepilin-type N-terminal cleavage/methylation domain-containing protein